LLNLNITSFNRGTDIVHTEKICGQRINLIEPLGYLDFLSLLSNARVVFTDSKEIQEEPTCLGVPCITIREKTERPITITKGSNILAGGNEDGITTAFEYQLERNMQINVPQFWDEKAPGRSVDISFTM